MATAIETIRVPIVETLVETLVEPPAPQNGNIVPAQMSNEELGEYVSSSAVGILKRLDVLKPYFEELWARFDRLQSGETINGCTTKTEFCDKILHRSRRSVNYILHGRTVKLEPPKVAVIDVKPAEEAATDRKCDCCGAEFESRRLMKAHRREQHLEEMEQRKQQALAAPSLREPVVESPIPSAAADSTSCLSLQNKDWMRPFRNRLHTICVNRSISLDQARSLATSMFRVTGLDQLTAEQWTSFRPTGSAGC